MTGQPQQWPAPPARGPVDATVSLPGSKSVTNRALLLGALAAGVSHLYRPLRSRDSALMAAALRALGATVDDAEDDAWVVTGPIVGEPVGDAAVDVGNAGTVMRFLPAVAGLVDGTVLFDGDGAARRRPVAELLSALRKLGVAIDDGGRGALPFTVTGAGRVMGGEVSLDASSSSQLVSALLLAGSSYDDGVVVRHVGAEPVPNAPHLAMTVAMLRDRGVPAQRLDDATWSVPQAAIAARDEVIEPDLSSAAPFLAAAVITGGRVAVTGWPQRSAQPGALLPELLAAFGATSSVEHGSLVVRGPATITGVDLDLRDCGELTPVLAALAALADGPSQLRGVGYLRGHETDRLAALAAELSGAGATVEETPDGLTITPGRLRPHGWRCYDDHRMAMAGAVVGLAVDGIVLDDVATTAKTLPDFARRWAAMLA